MLSNINNVTPQVYYPTAEEADALTPEQLQQFYNYLRRNRRKFDDNNCYYQGRNKAICEKKSVDPNAPDNRVITPYARTMTQIVTGYMGKPETITYHAEDEAYEENLKLIFDEVDEALKTNRIIANQSKYGIAFEYLHVNDLGQPEMTVVPSREVLPVYESINDDSTWCCLRAVYEKEVNQECYYTLFVFYKTRFDTFEVVETPGTDDIRVIQISTTPHFFGGVPIVDYWNNYEGMADYEPVKSLIDSYDLLNSDAINETERFASAYLVMKNVILADTKDPNQQRVFLDKIKQSRIFSVSNDGEINFLTKNIPTEFINSMRQAIREDIQYHSHIPDFRDQAFRAQSGEAQKWALFDFENLCSEKEALIREGLEHRIELINNFLGTDQKVYIKFERNIPISDTQMIDNAVKLKTAGLLSDEDILRLLPKDMIGDVDMALEKLNAQKQEAMKQFDLGSYSLDNQDNTDGQQSKQ